jgi:hypothetical protein
MMGVEALQPVLNGAGDPQPGGLRAGRGRSVSDPDLNAYLLCDGDSEVDRLIGGIA